MYDGNIAKKKKGAASPPAKANIPTAGAHPAVWTDAARSVPTNGPTHANDVTQKVNAKKKVATMPLPREA